MNRPFCTSFKVYIFLTQPIILLRNLVKALDLCLWILSAAMDLNGDSGMTVLTSLTTMVVLMRMMWEYSVDQVE